MQIFGVTSARVSTAVLCKEKRDNAAIKRKASSFEEILNCFHLFDFFFSQLSSQNLAYKAQRQLFSKFNFSNGFVGCHSFSNEFYDFLFRGFGAFFENNKRLRDFAYNWFWLADYSA